jgi:hypothetical protein
MSVARSSRRPRRAKKSPDLEQPGLSSHPEIAGCAGNFAGSSYDARLDGPPALIGVHEALGRAGGRNTGIVPKAPSR